MTVPSIAIAGRVVGEGHPPFVIAEGGVNHNGSLELALRLIDAAATAGADAVKFQTFRAEALATVGAEQAAYQRAGSPSASQVEMLRGLELGTDDWKQLVGRAREREILFLSTPFDVESVELLAALEIPAFKIGSGDLTNAILLRAVGRHRRPVILSTGMATLDEVAAGVEELRRAGAAQIALLHCTSAYPAAISDMNLRAMDLLYRSFGLVVGLSDHSVGLVAPVAAVARGASILEKHLTLDRRMRGPDHAASTEPDGFRTMVGQVHDAWNLLGDGTKSPRVAELDTIRVARRSLVTTRPLQAGHVLAATDLAAKRPGTGISPMQIDEVVGRRLQDAVPADHLIDAAELDPPLGSLRGVSLD